MCSYLAQPAHVGLFGAIIWRCMLAWNEISRCQDLSKILWSTISLGYTLCWVDALISTDRWKCEHCLCRKHLETAMSSISIYYTLLYWLLQHRDWLREISAPGANTTSIINPHVCTGQLARTLQHGSVPNLRGTCCNSGNDFVKLWYCHSPRWNVQTKVHQSASWTSFLPCTHVGMIVERVQLQDSPKQLALLHSDRSVEVVGTLEDEYASLSTGELQAVAWAPTVHMCRSFLLSLIPMNPFWVQLPKFQKLAVFKIVIAKYIKLIQIV